MHLSMSKSINTYIYISILIFLRDAVKSRLCICETVKLLYLCVGCGSTFSVGKKKGFRFHPWRPPTSQITERAKFSTKAVVIGGGLLGLEAAKARPRKCEREGSNDPKRYHKNM